MRKQLKMNLIYLSFIEFEYNLKRDWTFKSILKLYN